MKKIIFFLILAFFITAFNLGQAQTALPQPDSLIKGELATIYYYAADGYRYVFPNNKTFGSWFSDFGAVITVSKEVLGQIPLKGNVTYRPGVRMIKIQTVPKVYIVDKGGKLRWVKTEELAKKLYGDDWNKKIDDVPDEFFTNYVEGPPIESETEYNPFVAVEATQTINHDRGIKETATALRATTKVGSLTVPTVSAVPKPGEKIRAIPAIPVLPFGGATSTTSTPFVLPISATSTIPALPAIPAVPAVPAQPASLVTSTPFVLPTSATSSPAIPAVPAIPATPAVPAQPVSSTTSSSPVIPVPSATTTPISAPPPPAEATTPTPIATSISHTCGTPINVPIDTASIQVAFNSACSGDTILVSAGTYYENLTVPKSGLTLKGASGTMPEAVIVDGGGKDTVLYAANITSFTVEGMTLRNASKIGFSTPGGMALHLNPVWSGTFIARNLILRDSGAGFTIWNMSSGSVTLERSLITGNVYNGVEGGNIGSSQFYITNNTIANNGRSGYDDFAGGGYRTFRNNLITGNGWYGINPHYQSNRTILYNDVWNNALGNYYNGGSSSGAFTPSPGTGELSVDPQYIDVGIDYHLPSTSPVINVGDPATVYNDPNGSRSDMGAYYFAGTITPPVDTVPPTISLTSPVVGATVSGSVVTVTAASSDNVGVKSITFKLDGTFLSSAETSDATLPSTTNLSWNTTNTSNGSHTLIAVATDAAGNTATSTAITVTVNNPISLPAPLVGTGSGAFWMTPATRPRAKYNQRIQFNYYSGTTLTQVQSFRLYEKKPVDSSFNLVATFANPSSLNTNCGDSIVDTAWSISSCGNNSWQIISTSSFRDFSFFSVGEYDYYVTAVNSASQESAPSPTFKAYVLDPTEILSPTATNQPISKTPTFQWTIPSGLPSDARSAILVWEDTILTSSAAPLIYLETVPVIVGNTIGSKVYNGPAIYSTKKYVVEIYHHTSVNSTTNGSNSYISMLKNLETFTVPATVAKIQPIKQLAKRNLNVQKIALTGEIVGRSEVRFTRHLERGSFGDEVRLLQEALAQSPEIYPEGLITGYFGSLTEAAVKKFQKKYGLAPVGVVGPQTRAILNQK